MESTIESRRSSLDAGDGCASFRVLLFGILALLLSVVAAPRECAAADPPEPLQGVSAERGLARVEAERKPCLVIVIPVAASEEFRAELARKIRGSTRSLVDEEFVTIEVILGEGRAWPKAEPAGPEETPIPWPTTRARAFLEGRLGQLGDAPVVSILDFAGTLLVRFDGEPPAEPRLKKAIRAARAANANRKKQFVEAETGIEKFGISLKRKQYSAACRFFMEVRQIDLPLDSKPVADRDKFREDLEKAYKDRIAKVKKLEEKNEFAQAVAEYEKILQEFPLPEWQDEMRSRIGALWRKIYGPNPPGGGGPGGGQ